MSPEELLEPWKIPFAETVDEEDIFYFFRLLFGRIPSELEWYCHKTFSGKKVSEIFASYVASEEFKKRLSAQGIRSDMPVRKVDLGEVSFYLPEGDHAVGEVIFGTNTYEPNVFSVFRSIVKEGMTFLDIGANLGWYSIWGSHFLGDTGKVLAVEAGLQNANFLLANKALNKAENIEIFHVAALDAFSLLSYSSAYSNGFVRKAEIPEIGAVFGREIVQGVPLDSLLPEELKIDLVKIDIEGSEYKALLGMEKTLKKWKPAILSEYSPLLLQEFSRVSGEQYVRRILSLGYEMRLVDNDGTVAEIFVEQLDDELKKAKSDHLDLLFLPE